MHKKDLVKKIAKYSMLDESSTQEILNFVLVSIAQSLKKGKKVTLTGFGTFVVRKRKKRTIHDVNTGKMITVPAHKGIAFVVGLPLKRLVK